MPHLESQPVETPPLSDDLLNCSRTLHRLLTQLDCSLPDDGFGSSAPRWAALSEEAGRWENDLAEATVAHVVETFRPQVALVHLQDPLGTGWHMQAGAGLEDPSMAGLICESLRDFVQAMSAAPGQVRIADLQSDKRCGTLAKTPSGIRSLLSIPLIGGDNKPHGAISLGFDRADGGPSPAAIESLVQAGRQIGGCFDVHRRLAGRIAVSQTESDRPASGKLWRLLADRTVGEFPTLSLAVLTRAGNGDPHDFYAFASSQASDLRLFIARLDRPGPEMAWENLALDVAFRTSCVLDQPPAQIVDIMSRAWVGARGDSGHVRHVCCMDAAQSGREYLFAGSTSHFHYENRTQTIAEIYERLPENDGKGESWDGQQVPLHSGDVVLLHTCDLPRALPTRHEVHRRLAAILAREGRRPIGAVARQVADFLCTVATGSDPPAAVLVLLRAE